MINENVVNFNNDLTTLSRLNLYSSMVEKLYSSPLILQTSHKPVLKWIISAPLI